MNVAVIPARGGSKRIPRKNIREFHGRPMIGWPIATALESGCFTQVVVSTEDEETASIARRLGAAVLHRPPALADDHAATGDVMAHAARELSAEALCCIYATAAFVTAADLWRGRDLLDGCDFALTVTDYGFPIQRAVWLSSDSTMRMIQPEHLLTRSQDLEPAYHDAAQFYWGTRQAWLERRPVFSDRSRAIVIPRTRAQDIDTEEDWRLAQVMFAALQVTG